jgi:hypothetical protein
VKACPSGNVTFRAYTFAVSGLVALRPLFRNIKMFGSAWILAHHSVCHVDRELFCHQNLTVAAAAQRRTAEACL